MFRRQRLFFLFGVLILAACVSVRRPVCTPPPCRADEAYFCKGACPGGCGTTCATFTPGPPTETQVPLTETPTLAPATDTTTAETSTPADGPCLIRVRTPPPSAPTASLNGTPQPERRVDPHVEICASTAKLKVGETVTVVGQAVDIGLPYFQIHLKDSGTAEFAQLVEVTYDNQTRNMANVSNLFELVSAQADLNRVIVILRARAAGETQVAIGATGEVHYGYPGPAMWAGGGSDSISITVTE